MHGPVGKLLCRLRSFLFNCRWTPTQELDDVIGVQFSYAAKRFGMQGGDQRECEENIANALEESVKTIDACFEERTKELKRLSQRHRI